MLTIMITIKKMIIFTSTVKKNKWKIILTSHRSTEFRHKQKKVRNSIDSICSTLSAQKSSLPILIGKNIFEYLKKSKEKFKRLPPDVYDIVSKSLGDDDVINNEILSGIASLWKMRKQRLVLCVWIITSIRLT